MESTNSIKSTLRLFYPAIALFASLELLMWVHWNSLAETASMWHNPKYSHGYLVPLFAVVLLWLWRDEKQEISQPLFRAGIGAAIVGLALCFLPILAPDFVMGFSRALGPTVFEAVGITLACAGGLLILQPRFDLSAVSHRDRWIGLAIITVSEIFRYWATINSKATPDYFSVVPAIAGVLIMIGGLPLMRWAGWPVFFLIFMLPLPAYLDGHLSGNLQTMATRMSTFLLQTGGLPAHREGNKIILDGIAGTEQSQLNVAEACSGLRMLTIFGALSFAMALLSEDRPLWQRVVIVLSSIPIALVVNIARITATGLLYAMFPQADADFRHHVHDMWGFVMMPLAMLLIFLEFKILSNLLIEDEDDDGIPLPAAMGASRSRASLSPAGQLADGGGAPRQIAAPTARVNDAPIIGGTSPLRPQGAARRPGSQS